MPADNSLKFICECYHQTHNVKFSNSKHEWADDDETKSMSVCVSARNQLPFFMKLKKTFKYLFAKHDLEYEDVLLSKEDCKLIITYLNKFVEDAD